MRELPPSGHGRARGLVSSRESGARVEARIYAPPDTLADVVECFWVGRWDLPVDAPHVTELLGDPSVHLVAERGQSRVVGVWTKRWVRRLEGRGLVRAAKLRPGAVRAFFDVVARDLTDRKRPVGELGIEGAAFEREVLDPEGDDLALERLAARLKALRRYELAVARAVRVASLLREVDLFTVEALAERSGMSPRALQRLFHRHVGAPPKSLLRRVRLQEAALQIERGNHPGLASLAAELGYADQAHFTRDFHVAVGRPPTRLPR